MPVSLSIKDVPEEVRWRLRSRALCNHRSLRNELPAIDEPGSDGSLALVRSRRMPAPTLL
jgi:plasmid stability protein